MCVCVCESTQLHVGPQGFLKVTTVLKTTKLNQMAVMAYDWVGIIATDSVQFGSSVVGDYYGNFLRRKLRPTAAVGSWCVDTP